VSRIEYKRTDLGIEIRPSSTGGAVVRAETGSGPYQADVSREMLDEWRRTSYPMSTPLPLLNFVPDFSYPSATGAGPPAFWDAWRETVNARAPFRRDDRVSLPRVVLRISDTRLVGLDWEHDLRNMLFVAREAPLIVRASAVWPRSAAQPLTLPLRILEVSSVGDRRIVDHALALLQGFPTSDRDHALVAASCPAEALEKTWQYEQGPAWPTIDILHFDEFLQIAQDSSRRFSTASTRIAGTLGWLFRVADVNQTRLIVLRSWNPGEASELCKIAAAVTHRGGPAVVVVAAPPPSETSFCATLYDRLIHDHPIDAAFKDAFVQGPGHYFLFAGCGREDLLRVSNVGVGLRKLRVALAQAQADPDLASSQIVLSRRAGRSSLSMGAMHEDRVRRLGSELDQFEAQWHKDLRFEVHEQEGLIPMALRMRNIREVAGVASPIRVPPVTSAERFVNSSFWSEGTGGLRRIEQRGARLKVRAAYHLEVRIGAKDLSIQTIGEAPLVEEDFKWTPDMAGRWLEIGITGIDFDVLGDAVQDFWLPRDGDSEPVRFAISPRKSGAAWLRFCLYLGSSVLRSYRVAAVVLDHEEDAIDPATARRTLAAALGVEPDKVEGFGYMARLEYSVSPSVANAPDRQPPTISLVANDVNGLRVITMKGTDEFAVRVSGSLKEQVSDARRVLHLIEAPEQKELEPKDWPYGFSPDNAGTEAVLKSALARLAEVGWRLFDSVIPGDEDQKLRLKDLLASEPGVIEVAHVLLERVIPWALVYDREYDPSSLADREGNPIDRDVCLAAANQCGVKLACGEHPECLLHEANLQRRQQAKQPGLKAETVVCPLHFWGFRHVVEIPPQQVNKGDVGTSLQEKVLAGPSAEMLRAMNRSLISTEAHVRELDGVIEKATAPSHWKTTLYERTAIKNAMDDTQLDVLYFFCHARGGEADPKVKPPQLFFGEAPNSLAPEHLGSKAWTHRPLVILNGCGTVGYSPDALSPFIEKLVQDRGAAGVLGTEIPVWEPLATEFARLFLAEFLNNQTAGQALLKARRTLLAKNNPLGVIYTLYAAACLRLQRSTS
jgi:hypothetical protein